MMEDNGGTMEDMVDIGGMDMGGMSIGFRSPTLDDDSDKGEMGEARCPSLYTHTQMTN